MICIQLSGSLPPDGAVPNNNTSAPNLNASSIFSKIGISLSILHTSETDFPALLLSITQVIGLRLYLITPPPFLRIKYPCSLPHKWQFFDLYLALLK